MRASGHFTAITRGVIDLRDLIYFVSVMAAFLAANVIIVIEVADRDVGPARDQTPAEGVRRAPAHCALAGRADIIAAAAPPAARSDGGAASDVSRHQACLCPAPN